MLIVGFRVGGGLFAERLLVFFFYVFFGGVGVCGKFCALEVGVCARVVPTSSFTLF